MPTETQETPSHDATSNWKGSMATRQKVEEQIRNRLGEEAATEYDPRRNCLTLNLWLKKGYRVKKGEKAFRSITFIEKKDTQGNIVGKYPKKVFLFFKSQVIPIKDSSPNTL
jgi:hypothetical protein